MSLDKVTPGKDVPNAFNVIIEIPMNADPVKYEVDKETGAIFVVRCRAIGILKMEDEAGQDGKVLAVPVDKILSLYTQWQKPEDLNPLRLKTIAHFFEHYKDLEEGKWVKVLGWEGPESARQEILDGVANYEKEQAAN